MTVAISHEGAIAIVTVDNPPVNALSQALRQALMEAVSVIDADESVTAAVLICAGRTFIAGADVSEFDKPAAPPHLPDVVASIEAAKKPWVAAIHGSALGGGLEVALGCAYRIAAVSANLGLPEVKLGITPGAGGTVRLPRLIGISEAVDLVTTGSPVDARKAEALRLVDAVVGGDLLENAVAVARDAANRPRPQPICERRVSRPRRNARLPPFARSLASAALVRRILRPRRPSSVRPFWSFAALLKLLRCVTSSFRSGLRPVHRSLAV